MKAISACLLHCILFLLLYHHTAANGITISNVTVLPATSQIQFDISWQNSWRSDILNNWDAAWIFIKIHNTAGTWDPLALTNTGNSVGPGYILKNNFDQGGAFLFRSSAGSGTVTLTGVTLGIPATYATGVYDLKIFGIEMVYIPTSPFWVSDNKTADHAYYNVFGGSFNPLINLPDISANMMSLGSAAANIGDPLGVSPVTFTHYFPLGYDSFYCMKYEISQGAYRDFLNTLTYNQQLSRTTNAPGSPVGTNALTNADSARPFIEIAVPGISGTNVGATYGCDANGNQVFDEAGDGEWVACNYLSWPDVAAYLSWSGLEPMTELQFEKLSRGPLQPVSGEYAWGTALISSNQYTLSNADQTGEVIDNPDLTANEGNAAWSVTSAIPGRPLRNGIFATATSNRVSSGGGFYGVMDLSGNLWERTITTANSQGRSFYGSGIAYQGVAANGCSYEAVPGWNPITSTVDGTLNALGIIYRGGGWNSPSHSLQVSDRSPGNLVTTPDNLRLPGFGGRGVKN